MWPTSSDFHSYHFSLLLKWCSHPRSIPAINLWHFDKNCCYKNVYCWNRHYFISKFCRCPWQNSLFQPYQDKFDPDVFRSFFLNLVQTLRNDIGDPLVLNSAVSQVHAMVWSGIRDFLFVEVLKVSLEE